MIEKVGDLNQANNNMMNDKSNLKRLKEEVGDKNKSLKEKKRDFYDSIFDKFNKFILIPSLIISFTDLEVGNTLKTDHFLSNISLSLIYFLTVIMYKLFRTKFKQAKSSILSFLSISFIITIMIVVDNYKLIEVKTVALYYTLFIIPYLFASVLTYRGFKRVFDSKGYVYSKAYLIVFSSMFLINTSIFFLINSIFEIGYHSPEKFISLFTIFIILYFIESKVVSYDKNNINKVEGVEGKD
ncbi:hypothetical protein JXR93_03790 [bacterium]|nr:hypothetical protein [bacterium]